jgi:hypothetical protein
MIHAISYCHVAALTAAGADHARVFDFALALGHYAFASLLVGMIHESTR